jgi:kynurenine formamidase
MNDRWIRRPENSTWGDWGKDDQLGRLNLIDQQKVLEGIAEVKIGKTFCLSLPLDLPGGQVLNKVRKPPVLKAVERNGENYYNYDWSKVNKDQDDIGSDDLVILYTQYSTQWDSFAHRGMVFDVKGNGQPVPVYYNGFHAGSDIVSDDSGSCRAIHLGIEHFAKHGIQGRAVLIDLHSRFGDFPQKEVGYSEISKIIAEDQIDLRSGDVVCFWTGLDRLIVESKGAPDQSLREACSVLNGGDHELLNWIEKSGIAAIASDNLAIETLGKDVQSSGCCSTNLPLHAHCLFKLGVPLGELWYLEELALWLKQHKRTAFFLTAPPLRLPGAVGAPVTPLATV